MPYQLDAQAFYQRQDMPNGAVAVLNDHGLYWAASDDVDGILHEAQAAGDSPYAAVSFLLEAFADEAGIDIPDDNYSVTELAVMIANVRRENK